MDNINVEVKLQKQIGDVKIVMLKGDDGASIASIDKTSTEGLVDTYTITLTDGRHTTFQVTNGSSIATIEKTASIGHTDIYTITLTDGSTSTFEVTNGDNWIDNDEKTATDFFETINGGLLSALKVSLTPNQDLHGYDSPWAGGARKNKLPLTLANLKALNQNGTWSGNVYTLFGVSITVQTDNADNVIGINLNGLSTDDVQFFLSNTAFLNDGVSYTYTLGNASASTSTFFINIVGVESFASSYTFTANSSALSSRIYIRNGVTVSNQVIKPMIRLASESDPTFEPYENICPITGHTQSKIGDDGKNLLEVTATSQTINGVTSTVNNDGTILFNGTASADARFQLRPNNLLSLNAGRYILNGTPTTGGASTYRIVIYNQTTHGYSAFDNGGGAEFVLSETSELSVFIDVVNGVTIDNILFKPMIRLASDTDPTFSPYNGYRITVNLGGTYYSGILDIVSGVFVPDMAGVDLGTLTWGKYDVSQGTLFRAIISDIKKVANQYVVPNMICSQYFTLAQINRVNGSITQVANSTSVDVIDNRYSDVTAFTSAMSGVMLVYELANLTPIQLIPTPVKALVGENHLSAPLDGQEIAEVKYRYVFTWDDVNGITDGLKDRIDDIEDVLAETSYTSAVSCLVDDTTCTITDSNIKTTSLIEVFSSNSSGDTTVVTNIAVTNGQAVLTFDALVEATSFKLRITNL